jgi:hypothetical protein
MKRAAADRQICLKYPHVTMAAYSKKRAYAGEAKPARVSRESLVSRKQNLFIAF